jgi:hypothetical protein
LFHDVAAGTFAAASASATAASAAPLVSRIPTR